MASRKRNDQLAIDRPQPLRQHDQGAIRSASKFANPALNLTGISYVDRTGLKPQLRCHSLDCGPLSDAGGIGGIAKDRHAGQPWRNLFKQFRPFHAQAEFEIRESSRVSAWTCEACNEAAADRIGYADKYDRHDPCFL